MTLDRQNLIETAETLAAGFEALFIEVAAQKNLEQSLRNRLDQILYSHGNQSGNSVDEFDSKLTEQTPTEPQDPIPKAYRALRRWRMSSDNPSTVPLRKCPVTHQTTDQEDFEHDFTTPGKTGNLQCPFASISGNALPMTPNSTIDPLAAEFHPNIDSETLPQTNNPIPGQCPIRFLDRHSPEELAKYFENHKHEIPRSHEVCVKRYQRNEQGIRQLDAKYGNLVSMIQGLGVKHKQYLPNNDEGSNQGSHSIEAVDRWAEGVDKDSHPVQPDSNDEGREPHFQRPLKEVRVGESPSRPWGISVPIDKNTALSPDDYEIERDKPEISKDKKLFSTQAAQPTDTTHNRSKPQISPTDLYHTHDGQTLSAKDHQTIIFNGPVFFGYSAEEATKFLQNFSSNTRPEN